jgi:hypothetical protein
MNSSLPYQGRVREGLLFDRRLHIFLGDAPARATAADRGQIDVVLCGQVAGQGGDVERGEWRAFGETSA